MKIDEFIYHTFEHASPYMVPGDSIEFEFQAFPAYDKKTGSWDISLKKQDNCMAQKN